MGERGPRCLDLSPLLPEELTPHKGLWATRPCPSQGCTPELERAPTFFGENTPNVPPSSLMATPISASSASLWGQRLGQLEPRGRRTCLAPNRPVGRGLWPHGPKAEPGWRPIRSES